ncbi:tyrosine-type recombinase/integrase [Siphonobacter sp. SORGH_AS_1065]|uniref:tyrosine-type recombinase/integrase n=1 Tax=Siphonobacter sp. SORGH_AS_1065 TaxID=3041795 RepID=UPI002784F7B5|nr:tyrosine-type recombinase/integrase [Siphonobacter sp. SORGH_AS_1065]MDQ1089028.1 integrase [Siphonobacter sp. SORGH_AS_1065]
MPSIVEVPKAEAISSHVARHTFATLLSGLNIPQKFIQDTLGHSDQRQTAIYTHYVESEASRQIVQAIKKIASSDLKDLIPGEAS